MASDYSSGMEEKKRGKPREKMRGGTPRGGDYASGMEEKKSKPKPKPTPKPSAPFSSAVEGEAQAASREAAKRQAARSAASTAGRGALGTAARFAGPAGALYGGYELGSALKDTKLALAARDKVAGFLNRRTEYKQEQADKAAMEAARKRGEAKRDAGKPDYMSQVSANALKKFQDKELPKINVTARKRVMPVADVPTKAAPKAAAKPKVDRMKDFMGSLDEDSAVTKKLRERSKMSQEERNKPFGEDNEVLKKLRAAGYNFAKGGKINGVARKGKTKGRFI